MTKGNQKLLCEENLRHAEYYSMLSVFDDLYEKSKSGVVFEDLMPLILKRENILLAYRNIKTNTLRCPKEPAQPRSRRRDWLPTLKNTPRSQAAQT